MRTPRWRVGPSSDLARIPTDGGAVPATASAATIAAAARRTSSSSASGRAAVAVLGVDPQVLDRLGGQLGPHPGQHLLDQRRVQAEVGQAVLVERGQRARRPTRAARPGTTASAGT